MKLMIETGSVGELLTGLIVNFISIWSRKLIKILIVFIEFKKN